MPIEDDYTPKYVDDLSDVPISGPDDYKPEEKRKALFQAETELELDVNEGDQINGSSVTDAHRAAAINLATHILTHAAEEPSDVTLGDMQDGGGTITNYSSRYLDAYNELVDKILASGGGRGEDYAVVVNNGNVGSDSKTHTVS